MEALKSIHNHSFIFLAILVLFATSALMSSANANKVHEHQFVVQASPVKRLCKTHNTITVNGQFPGPTLEINNGDTLVVKVINKARYNVTIHWHGVRQMRTGWADGPEFVTQCPIRPGESYTYRFTIEGQEGTLWWHAHSSWLRATVYGALIIRPRQGEPYPFPKPKRETPILLGEWWDTNPIDVLREATRTGAAPNVSDAYTINGQPGDLYKCSSKGTTVVPIDSGETNLLRVINAALNQPLFFTVANHKLTVVGADASYLKPFTTTVLMLGPGQTTDVLITADQPPSQYYMAARAYQSAQNAPFDNTTTTAILQYKSATCSKSPCSKSHHTKPIMPPLPAYNDTNTVTSFSAKFRSPRKAEVPTEIDESLFVTVGLGLNKCPPNFRKRRCQGPNGTRFTASMNNVSFALPNNISILQAHQQGIPGVFTSDFPARPPVKFDYTGNVSRSLWQPNRGTKVYKLKYGSRVQVVLQDTNIVTSENHPIHLHGYDFYIVAQGFGNFNPKKDSSKFNLIDPPMRNTVAVPVNGWAVIRFVADNPGAWIMHCHLDVHINWGLAMVFVVENGVGKLQSIEPPPADLPLNHPITEFRGCQHIPQHSQHLHILHEIRHLLIVHIRHFVSPPHHRQIIIPLQSSYCLQHSHRILHHYLLAHHILVPNILRLKLVHKTLVQNLLHLIITILLLLLHVIFENTTHLILLILRAILLLITHLEPKQRHLRALAILRHPYAQRQGLPVVGPTHEENADVEAGPRFDHAHVGVSVHEDSHGAGRVMLEVGGARAHVIPPVLVEGNDHERYRFLPSEITYSLVHLLVRSHVEIRPNHDATVGVVSVVLEGSHDVVGVWVVLGQGFPPVLVGIHGE
ncbi:laccase-5-like [Senna tora]|uniref:Laccase n=1 Tax=Senna tora TaxID=362788 RepID=A0A834U4D1_9FABA|nr:laccase-5-like [Senna tora]